MSITKGMAKVMSVLSRTVYINNFLTVSEGSTGTRLSEVNQYWGGGSRINLNCFCTFLLLLCVFLIQMEIIGGGGGLSSDGLEENIEPRTCCVD
jgi:hypothetical protein